MERLFQLLYRYRAFILFLFLEYLSFVLIKNRTIYQQTKIVKAGIEISGRIKSSTSNVSEYLNLKEHNKELQVENAKLRELLAQRAHSPNQSPRGDRPPSVLQQYYYVPAEVINNSTNRFNNYLTLNKGAIHGIKPNMAVIGSKGIIGKVESVSSNYSTVVSVLHTGYYVASKITPSGIQATLKWDAESSEKSRLLYVPRHLKINPGDTVKTSGFNAVFPPEVDIGIISKVELSEDATFYDLSVKLFTNFNSIKHVYLVGNRLREEKLELEQELSNE
ncbi:rod shape-determining protein MreC [Hyphobacterium sp. CCMP332]|nr:rod shape-determining protein MreC [Hyphobacterium sp. CCMP332]